MEIENDGYGPQSAITDLVNGLNDTAGAGTYAFVDPGVPVVGTDEIAVGLIYKPATVTPAGDAAILDSSVDSRFVDTKNRPVLAQTFDEIAGGGRLTVAVNHLKSKGSACDDVGDPDTGDGQGNCNQTRTDAAQALVAWLATDPTASKDADFLIIGDLNAYAKEDPITTITDASYIDLLDSFIDANSAYSYVFEGQSGYLDHALASSDLARQVTGVEAWHINADEPRVLDYNVEFKSSSQVATFYGADAYRSSDHDPIIVGLSLDPPPVPDSDGDGVNDDADQCPDTAPADAVEANGCSVAQLVPCDAPFHSTTPWRNHGQYVSSVAQTAERFVEADLISPAEKDAIVSAAAQSACGAKSK